MRFQKIGMGLKIVRSQNRACGCEPGFKVTGYCLRSPMFDFAYM